MKLVSIFRDSAGYVERYREQVKSLREYMPVDVIAVEGDSTDDTFDLLKHTDYKVLKVEHGGPMYPSAINPLRWRQLAAVCNVALTAAVRELHPDEPLVYVESDLIWSAETIAKLIGHLSMYPAVAPMSMCGPRWHHHDRFYDTWGYTKNWVPFRAYPPYFDGWSETMMHDITSAGSCIGMSFTAAQCAHFSPHDCIRGIGRTISEAGFNLWLDPILKVVHP